MTSTTTSSLTPPSFSTVRVQILPQGVGIIQLSQPEKANSLTGETYADLLESLLWLGKQPSAKVVVLTGMGKFYTSGQDLTIVADINNEAKFKKTWKASLDFVDAVIDFEKPLVAAVNGHAVGFGVTSLGLCDMVYSSEDATFQTPFMQLAFCAESCSTYTFPRILGPSRAKEMLLLNRTFTATELVDAGFVARTFPGGEGFLDRVIQHIAPMGRYESVALTTTKRLIHTDEERRILREVNHREMVELEARMKSKESQRAIRHFFASRKPGKPKPKSKL